MCRPLWVTFSTSHYNDDQVFLFLMLGVGPYNKMHGLTFCQSSFRCNYENESFVANSTSVIIGLMALIL